MAAKLEHGPPVIQVLVVIDVTFEPLPLANGHHIQHRFRCIIGLRIQVEIDLRKWHFLTVQTIHGPASAARHYGQE